MSDSEFYAWVEGWCYAKQGEGYGAGTPPASFKPIIVLFKNADGSYNRERMLASLDVSAEYATKLLAPK